MEEKGEKCWEEGKRTEETVWKSLIKEAAGLPLTTGSWLQKEKEKPATLINTAKRCSETSSNL